MNRRRFLAAAATLSLFGLRGARAQTAPGADVLFVQLQATGGWDPLLFCDPKVGLRDSVRSTSALRVAGGIPYARPDTPSGAAIEAFFLQHHARLLVLNGVDTSTNNHEVGVRYSQSGSLNSGYPIFAAQVAAAFGDGRPMPFLALGGHEETGELLAPTRLSYENLGLLRELRTPRRYGGDWVSTPTGGENYPAAPYLPDAVGAQVDAARLARLQRLRARVSLPSQRAALEHLASAQAGALRLRDLELPDGLQSDTLSLVRLGLRAYQRGLAVSVCCESGGFDTHAGAGGDVAQSAAIAAVLGLASAIVAEADRLAVPAVVVLASDFGRTPYADGGGGTDHWPVGSVLLLHSAAAAPRTGLPTDRAVGVTTGGDGTRALRPVRLDPRTFAPSDAGIVMTPGHVVRALRRVARIEGHPSLARFPLRVEGADLGLG